MSRARPRQERPHRVCSPVCVEGSLQPGVAPVSAPTFSPVAPYPSQFCIALIERVLACAPPERMGEPTTERPLRTHDSLTLGFATAQSGPQGFWASGCSWNGRTHADGTRPVTLHRVSSSSQSPAP